MTVRDIVEDCKMFFFVGKQTTSNLLTWTTVVLAMHPEWQECTRAEVLRVGCARDLPSCDHLAKLTTVCSPRVKEATRNKDKVNALIQRSLITVEDLDALEDPIVISKWE
ncbi:hypothetical protein Cni_G09359 [Canna indica]|uniref:Cytochrome P450 n=1 Tax=Canna indica TaxID=4628 RepID=A0AAQ3Q8T1_9LILI|nr:hypothetical protein Cni_G09359 [Canna indica]